MKLGIAPSHITFGTLGTTVQTFKKPLTRKKTEAVKIASSQATNLMNSKAEHRQPALHRVQMVRDLEELQPPGGRGGGGGGGEECRKSIGVEVPRPEDTLHPAG